MLLRKLNSERSRVKPKEIPNFCAKLSSVNALTALYSYFQLPLTVFKDSSDQDTFFLTVFIFPIPCSSAKNFTRDNDFQGIVFDIQSKKMGSSDILALALKRFLACILMDSRSLMVSKEAIFGTDDPGASLQRSESCIDASVRRLVQADARNGGQARTQSPNYVCPLLFELLI